MGHLNRQPGGSAEGSEVERRQRLLLGLRWELQRLGMAVAVRKPSDGAWQLRVQAPGWSYLVRCAGMEDDFVFVNGVGLVLGAARDRRHVARTLWCMSERKQVA